MLVLIFLQNHYIIALQQCQILNMAKLNVVKLTQRMVDMDRTTRESTEMLIKMGYPHFSKSEKIIADFVLKDMGDVAVMPLGQLSKMTGISEPSIIRFVRKLGFDGYSAFKRHMLRDDSITPDIRKPADNPILTPATPLERIPENIVSLTCNALQDTLRIVNTDSYKKAIEWIKASRRVDIFGVGYSGNVANDLMIRLVRIGIDCRAQSDSALQQLGANALSKGDLAIGISFSGRTISIINALKAAKSAGARTIAITSYRSSEIIQDADISLLTSDMQGPLFEHMTISRILQTTVTDILYMGILLSEYDKYSANYQYSQNILEQNEEWRKRKS